MYVLGSTSRNPNILRSLVVTTLTRNSSVTCCKRTRAWDPGSVGSKKRPQRGSPIASKPQRKIDFIQLNVRFLPMILDDAIQLFILGDIVLKYI